MEIHYAAPVEDAESLQHATPSRVLWRDWDKLYDGRAAITVRAQTGKSNLVWRPRIEWKMENGQQVHITDPMETKLDIEPLILYI